MKSRVLSRSLCLALLVWSAACGGARVAPATPEPVLESTPVPPFPHPLAWTASADVVLRTEAGEVRIPNPFTRLNVLRVDTLGVQVRCLYCIPSIDGWISRDDVVYEPASPTEAAEQGLAEFVLAVREAAARRDEAALRPAMSRDFTFAFEGGGGPIDAFRRWEFQGFRSLDNLPPLLDRGLVTRDSVIWLAPPAFATDPEYHGLRAGFRQGAGGRWEWIFLVGGG